MGVLEGKIAVVTGAGRGIGRKIALDFVRAGAKVVVNDLGAAPDGTGAARVADEVVAEIRNAGGEAVANYDSVATVAGGEAIFQAAIDAFGGLDILVNNAGILRDRTIFKMTEDDWDAVIAVHLKGHYCCTAPFARYVRDTNRRGCRILNFSSVSGLFGNFGQSNYGAAKAGIAGFSRVLALEMAKYECTVNTISPGAATRLTIPLMAGRGASGARSPQGASGAAQRAEGERRSSGPKASEGHELGVAEDDWTRGPEQIAPVCTWLASEAGKAWTGQIVNSMRGTLGIMQQPAIIRSFTSDHLWTQTDLDRAMPAMLDAKRAHDLRVKREGEPEEI